MEGQEAVEEREGEEEEAEEGQEHTELADDSAQGSMELPPVPAEETELGQEQTEEDDTHAQQLEEEFELPGPAVQAPTTHALLTVDRGSESETHTNFPLHPIGS